MPISALSDQLLQFLSTSQAFQAIEVSQREKLMQDIKHADETQLGEMLAILKEEEEKFKVAQQKRLAVAQDQISMAEKLHQQIKESDRALLQAKEKEDQIASVEKLAAMEKTLKPEENTPNVTKPRKKFLGIF